MALCGRTGKERVKDKASFPGTVSCCGPTLNHSKSILRALTIAFLGYETFQGVIMPDLERLKPLHDKPPRENLKPQRRVVGLLAYYSHQIPRFSDSVHRLAHNLFSLLFDYAERSSETLKFNDRNAAVTIV